MWEYRYTEDCILKGKCPKECSPSCTIQPELYYLLDSSNIPEAYKRPKVLRPEQRDVEVFFVLRAIQEDIEMFVQEGRILYLWGTNVGNGKTEMACKIMKTYLLMKCFGNGFKDRAWFEYVPSFLLLAKDFENKEKRQEHINNLTTRDLVILDDVGAIRNTQYDIAVLSDIINTRYSKGLATIYTSNLSPNDLQIDERLKDRIASDIVLEIQGDSHRESTNTYKRKVGESVVRSGISDNLETSRRKKF